MEELMKENYSKICEDILSNIDANKRILLHSCCAPCSSYVISYLTKYFDITILYYNPNISPYDEYLKRKNEQIKLIHKIDTINKIDIMDCDYDNELYNNLITGLENEPERGSRCNICYRMRMEKTAVIAKENNYDFFCTTLSVSPYKNSNLINEIGENLEKMYNIKWLYSDFKKKDGYKQSIELSKKYNLYRQDYCGCIYSKPKSIHITN
jgi:predicted adenine nucleotide alpha hydrolase (AANH) superfamily ATPase